MSILQQHITGQPTLTFISMGKKMSFSCKSLIGMVTAVAEVREICLQSVF